MAYHSSDYYELDPIYHHQNLYGGCYNLITYPDDHYDQYNYLPTYYYGDYNYDSAASRSIISYSASTIFTEPKYIEQELHNFTISYSVAGFNEPDYLEYDPTPYGGGYDITQQYGKPLPPSKEICYPLSSASNQPPPLMKPAEFPSGEEGKLTTINEEDESQASTENDEPSESEDDESGDESLVKFSEESKPNSINEEVFDGNNEHEKAVSQTPPGYYGSGSMDFCESLYDYWPCFSRDRKKNESNDFQQEGNINNNYTENQWEGAADYLFGSSYPYSERRDAAGSFESLIYGYERHYQQESLKFEQPVYGDEYSWGSEYTLN